MREETARIYCAGPLFTIKEKEEMFQIAEALETKGFKTFLPQRDGLEHSECVEYLVSKDISSLNAGDLISRAIFALDIFQVLRGCDALFSNLNGRVPDEGTVSETAIAWSRGKIVVGYKTDNRTVFNGQNNPLVAGLFNFRLYTNIKDAVDFLEEEFNLRKSIPTLEIERESEINSLVSLGSQIWSILEKHRHIEIIAEIIFKFNQSH